MTKNNRFSNDRGSEIVELRRSSGNTFRLQSLRIPEKEAIGMNSEVHYK